MIDDFSQARDIDDPEVSGGDGVDRRGFLQCMAWAGTGLVWTATGGLLSSRALSPASAAEPALDFSFVQISDTHIGFKGEANKDALGTFEQAIARIKALEPAPAFIIHTGDITHAQKAGAFDIVTEALKGTKAERLCRRGQGVPGPVRRTDGHRLAELRLQGRPLHRADQCAQLQGGGARKPRTGPARLAQEGR